MIFGFDPDALSNLSVNKRKTRTSDAAKDLFVRCTNVRSKDTRLSQFLFHLSVCSTKHLNRQKGNGCVVVKFLRQRDNVNRCERSTHRIRRTNPIY